MARPMMPAARLPAAYQPLTSRLRGGYRRSTIDGAMPEGDTIHRTAEVLRRALVGRTVTAARAQPRPGLRSVPRMERIVGAGVTAVEARGKHLLIGFDYGLTLRTHMRMRGAWHRYRPGERWRRPAHEATVVVETAESVAVCFGAPVAELLTDADLARHPALATLGPDLLADDFDTDAAIARLRAPYRRAGRPCRRCGTRIEARRQGELGRVTYWCPRCQGRSG
jgi:formamidopyrimidine-DNA glycosylase